MKERFVKRQRRIRVAAVLVALGLVVELITLRWSHPLTFILFFVVSGLSIAAASILFLTTLFATGPVREEVGAPRPEELS